MTIAVNYCPQCGHAAYEDMAAKKLFGVQVVICPAERIRFTFVEATGILQAVKL